jgi:predicted ATP-binding protein involved in virulence
MELVYLWVEEYKNIKQQGFNFSPRFTCKYDKDKNELTIEEKKDYVSIFPENINVTAIVGENGAGKSTLIEFLSNLFSTNFLKTPPNNFILLYIYKNEPKYFLSTKTISNINELRINGLSIKEQEDLLLNFRNEDNGHENLISLYLNNEYADIETRESPQFFIENSKKSLRDINGIIIENSINLKSNLPNIHNYFIPTKISIKLQKVDYFTSILDKDREFYKDVAWDKISALKDKLEDTTLSEKIELVRQIFKIKREECETIINESFISLSKVKTKQHFKWAYKDFGEKIPTKILDNKTIGNEHILYISDVDKEVLTFLYELPKEFDIELQDEKIKFHELSFGERQLLIQINNILKYLLLNQYSTFDYDHEGEEHEHKYDINEIVIFVDEFEIGLHPNWQKKFFSYFYEISKLTPKKIYLIISSHSPFLLSDLPKENVIFLENGKQMYPHIETFGANIHTLLSHGFFMKDGLMGEFAKSKINEVIDYLNGKDSPITDDDEAQRYIHIIGEPIVKRQLQRMLDSKKLDKVKEIDELKSKIESLKNRLDILVNKS